MNHYKEPNKHNFQPKKNPKIYRLYALIAIVIGVVLVIGLIVHANTTKKDQAATQKQKVERVQKKKVAAKKAKAKKKAKNADKKVSVNYNKPSESKPYPNLKKHPDLWVHVSIGKQRVYLMDHNKTLYTMYASTGIEDGDKDTPKGTFHIQQERGDYFYSASVQEGAYNWTSFKDHGVYLFHSTPTYENKKIMPGPAKDLGNKPSSHGCVHLTLPDSKWMMNLPVGTKVVID